jgi:(p)ppGpp synthase/HD superfamily hydrolase
MTSKQRERLEKKLAKLAYARLAADAAEKAFARKMEGLKKLEELFAEFEAQGITRQEILEGVQEEQEVMRNFRAATIQSEAAALDVA